MHIPGAQGGQGGCWLLWDLEWVLGLELESSEELSILSAAEPISPAPYISFSYDFALR